MKRLLLLTAFVLAFAGLRMDQVSAADGDEKALIAAVQKLKGFASVDKMDSAKPVLRIDLRSFDLKDDDLKQLRPLLEKSTLPIRLNLNGAAGITDAGLAHLKDLPTLQSLALSEVKFTPAALKNLTGLTNLESLYLSSEELTDADLAPLGKLTKLRDLSVSGSKLTPAAYAHLEDLTQLEEIRVGNTFDGLGDEYLAHMKKMTKLKKLHIGKDKLTDAGMAHMKNFTELRELDLEGPKVTPAGLASLAALKKLQKLTVLSCDAINGDGMAPLKELTELQSLEFVYCGPLNAKATAHLQGLTKLKRLRFDSVENEALQGIAGLKNLEDLQLFYTTVGDAGLKHLSGLTGLRSLNLMKTQVTDAGLMNLSGLTELKRLSLSDNKITDEGLQHLAKMTGLEELGISDCKITGAGLKNLSGLMNLNRLWLNGNPLTDAGLAHLKGMTKLTDLHLTGTKVTDEEVLALKKALPKARILDYAGDEVVLEKKEPPKRVIEDISKIEPAFSLTSEKFAEECKEQKTANEKFKGKVIELSGVVKTVGQNFSGDPYVALEVGKDFTGVMCFTADAQPWAKVVPGQKIKLKGKWPQDPFGPSLHHCVFVDTGKSPAIILTAQELAKEYAADKDATGKKYADKYLIVTGEVVDKEFNSVGAASVTLKVEGKVKVKCSFTAFEKGMVKPIKIGQQLKAVGQYTLNFGDEEVVVYFCHPIKQP
jgi:Leucine-rich repeat (LRR) protein